MMTNESNLVHKFEAAGLGKAPFRFMRMERKVGPIKMVTKEGFTVEIGAPGQAMSSCDYCGQGIAYEFWIRGADGREFKVGCDCVSKTGDAGLTKQVNKKKAAHDRELRQARKERNKAANAATVEERHGALLARLAQLEEVGGFHARFAKDIARQLRNGLMMAPSPRQTALIEKLCVEKGI